LRRTHATTPAVNTQPLTFLITICIASGFLAVRTYPSQEMSYYRGCYQGNRMAFNDTLMSETFGKIASFPLGT